MKLKSVGENNSLVLDNIFAAQVTEAKELERLAVGEVARVVKEGGMIPSADSILYIRP